VYHIREIRVVGLQSVKCTIQGNPIQFVHRHIAGRLYCFKRESHAIAATFWSTLCAGSLNQNSPHGQSGCREKVLATIPAGLRAADQPHVRLMHKCRGLQRLARTFRRKFAAGELTQVVIHQWQKLRCNFRIASGCRFEQCVKVGGRIRHA